MARQTLLLMFVLLGCASAAPPPPVPTVEPAPAPAAVPVAPEEPPSAQVVAVEPGKESALDLRAKIVFTNPTKHACRVQSYKLAWPGSSKVVKVDGLSIPAGETRERWLKLHPNDGELAKVTPADTRVELDCDPR